MKTTVVKKILEKPIDNSVEEVRRKIDEKLAELLEDASFKEIVDKFKITHSWRGNNTLLMESGALPVRGALILSEDKVEVYIEIPFYISPFLPLFSSHLKRFEEEMERLIT